MRIEEEKDYLWITLILVIVATVTFLVISLANRDEPVAQNNAQISAKSVQSQKLTIEELTTARDKIIPKCTNSELCKKVLKPYKLLTVKTETTTYSVKIIDGEITEIVVNGKGTPDIVISTTDAKVREVYGISLTNDYSTLLATVRNEIPLNLYLRALQAVAD